MVAAAHKIIILAAPSGSGKTTIMARLMKLLPESLSFSISATTRSMRKGEQDGVDYFFISADAFREKISQDGFIEWEMVYEGMYYGTTRDEMQRIWNQGKTPLLDIDVYGAMKVKQLLGSQVLTIFIEPPSVAALQERLEKRGTDSAETIRKRIGKAEEEIAQKVHFDHVVLNEDLEKATAEVLALVQQFLSSDE